VPTLPGCDPEVDDVVAVITAGGLREAMRLRADLPPAPLVEPTPEALERVPAKGQ